MSSCSFDLSRLGIRGPAVFLSALVLSASLASAQASRVGPTFLVNQYANGSGTQAKETDVAYDSIHSVYLEVWGFGLVYGRFVTGDGTVLGTGPFTIAGGAGYAACPRVAFSAEANAFMVIWQDNRLNANIPHIFGRLLAFQPSGEPAFQGADFQVSADVTHPRANPAIEYSTGSHVFLAVYQRGDLYGRRFDVTGAALGPEFKLTTDGSWYEQPDVAYNPTADEFFVTFAHWIDVWGAGLIQGRRVRAGTEELLTLVDIDALSRSTYGPTAVAYDGVRNQYLVAWYRVISAFSIYGRLIAANGTPVSSQFTVSSTGTYVANGAAYNPVSDTYFVVFPHHDIAEIYGVEVSGTGVADAMIRVTTVLDSAPTALGVDYPKVATATDRPEWLATANIWWSGAIGQRVRTATVGTPGIFSKMSPSNGAAGQASSVTLSWTPVTDGSFEVCVDAINNNACDTAWQFVGLPTAATIGNLADGTYYWQVRNAAAGNTEANTGTWWSFAVGAVSFAKVAPTNGTGGLSSPVVLTWSQLAGASSYQVCVDSTGNGSCDSSWVSVGNVTSYPAPLSVGTYYWQVRGYMGSYVVADGGTEWVFTVTLGQTAPYTKLTPANGTTGVTNPVSFTWTAMAGATTYDICVDQVNDAGCNTSWTSVGTATSYQISGVADGTYYWQVRAWPTRTMADNDAWGGFTVGGAPRPLAGPDFNGDGKPDLVWRNGVTGQNVVWLMNGTALLGQVLLPEVADTQWQLVAAADFNGDGKPDLLWRNQTTGWNVVWSMNGTTLLLSQAVLPGSTDTTWQIAAAADFNRDGKPDLVWRNRTTGQNVVWYLDGVTFLSQALLPTVTDTNWQIVAAGDFSRDGKPDLVWRNRTTGQHVVWYLDGVTFLSQAVLPPVADPAWRVGTVADLNGDGQPDLVWRNQTTGLNVAWYLDGVTLLSQVSLPLAAPPWDFPNPPRPAGTTPVDFDGNGTSDLVWRNASTGQNAVWLMSGTTSMSEAVLPAVTDTTWQIAAAADLNVDGQPDLVWRNESTGQNVVWYLNGVTLVGDAALPPVADPAWQIVAAADLNGDGKPDLVWRNYTTGQNAVWYLNGVTLVGDAALPPVADPAWQLAVAGDFNGDEKPDLVWRNYTTGQNAVWYLNGVTLVGDAALPPVADPAWQLAMAGDFNGDGKLDLAWRNYATGQDVVWLMDGTTLVSPAFVSGVGDTNWTLLRDRR